MQPLEPFEFEWPDGSGRKQRQETVGTLTCSLEELVCEPLENATESQIEDAVSGSVCCDALPAKAD